MIILNHECVRLIPLPAFTKCSGLFLTSIARNSEQKITCHGSDEVYKITGNMDSNYVYIYIYIYIYIFE